MRNHNIKWFDLQAHRIRLSSIISVQRVETVRTSIGERYGFTVVTSANAWSVQPLYKSEAEAVAVYGELCAALDCQAAGEN